MDYQEAVRQLDPTLIERLRRAVETGRWPDGRPVSGEQREHCLQAIISWEASHLAETQRVGFIDKGRKAQAETCDSPQPLRWLNDVPGTADVRDDQSDETNT